jgi:hypothetical protein
MQQHRKSVISFSPQRPMFVPRAVHVGCVVDKVALGQVCLYALLFPLSISYHQHSIFNHVSFAGWPMGLLAAAVPKRHTSPHHNNKHKHKDHSALEYRYFPQALSAVHIQKYYICPPPYIDFSKSLLCNCIKLAPIVSRLIQSTT